MQDGRDIFFPRKAFRGRLSLPWVSTNSLNIIANETAKLWEINSNHHLWTSACAFSMCTARFLNVHSALSQCAQLAIKRNIAGMSLSSSRVGREVTDVYRKVGRDVSRYVEGTTTGTYRAIDCANNNQECGI
jgi:hypothetical protein